MYWLTWLDFTILFSLCFVPDEKELYIRFFFSIFQGFQFRSDVSSFAGIGFCNVGINQDLPSKISYTTENYWDSRWASSEKKYKRQFLVKGSFPKQRQFFGIYFETTPKKCHCFWNNAKKLPLLCHCFQNINKKLPLLCHCFQNINKKLPLF